MHTIKNSKAIKTEFGRTSFTS